MDITCRINLSDNEINQLSGILRCEIDDLDNELSKYGNAALEEYIRLFLGQKVFTRGSDFREYRLCFIIYPNLSSFRFQLPQYLPLLGLIVSPFC